MKQKAHWIQRTHLFDPDEFECSVCGARFRRKAAECPACGAVMHGLEYDPSWVDEAEFLDIIIGDH